MVDADFGNHVGGMAIADQAVADFDGGHETSECNE
jgi:hypothetical protein